MDAEDEEEDEEGAHSGIQVLVDSLIENQGLEVLVQVSFQLLSSPLAPPPLIPPSPHPRFPSTFSSSAFVLIMISTCSNLIM